MKVCLFDKVQVMLLVRKGRVTHLGRWPPRRLVGFRQRDRWSVAPGQGGGGSAAANHPPFVALAQPALASTAQLTTQLDLTYSPLYI